MKSLCGPLTRLNSLCGPQTKVEVTFWTVNLWTVGKRWVPHLPRFPAEVGGVGHSMRLSLTKGAHADLSGAAWQEIGGQAVFWLEWDTQHSTPQFRPVIRSRGTMIA